MHLVLILLWLVNFPFQPFAPLMSHSPSSTNCYIFWHAILFKLDSIIIQSVSWVYRVHYRCFILICISDTAWWQHKVKKKILEKNLLLQIIFILVETHSSLGETTCISLLALNTIHKNCYISICVWQITITVLHILFLGIICCKYIHSFIIYLHYLLRIP